MQRRDQIAELMRFLKNQLRRLLLARAVRQGFA